MAAAAPAPAGARAHRRDLWETPVARTLRRAGATLARTVLILLLAFVLFGPLANLVLWAFAERWYFPSRLPLENGFTFWHRVFAPRGNALSSLGTSVWIAVLTVLVSLAVAIPRTRNAPGSFAAGVLRIRRGCGRFAAGAAGCWAGG